MSAVLTQAGSNSIVLNPVPLGSLGTGVSMPALVNSTVTHTQTLKGVSIIVGSAILIDPKVSTVALDLEFIPDSYDCPEDLMVSRAVFANTVGANEPVNLTRALYEQQDPKYFYSEISGAKQARTIFHYWFADGKPVAVEELTVSPGGQWRTWSTSGTENTLASHWAVLVVDKQSGCILHAGSINTSRPENLVTRVDQRRANETLDALHEAFEARLSGFSIVGDKPQIALIEVSRVFMQDALQKSMDDLQIGAELEQATLPKSQISARMRPIEPKNIVCEHRSCPSPRICTSSQLHCKRIRDTRNCTSCVFRNPLNRCCRYEPR